MVIRRRFRNLLIPLALYAVSVPVSGYFIWHAVNGERGLKKRAAYEQQMKKLIGVAGELARERQSLERKIALMRPPAVDRDILEERARSILGQVGKNDVVVFLPAGTNAANAGK
ncbi:MAG: septum formation initiator family protein [Hyphomicrobiales bacterium]|nr:septum formation initiator family protein [Hyphomicrobiales bacterium]